MDYPASACGDLQQYRNDAALKLRGVGGDPSSDEEISFQSLKALSVDEQSSLMKPFHCPAYVVSVAPESRTHSIGNRHLA